ncbi:MAG: histidine--tRNA ligase [Xanthomonadales bacterium]|nr:histidine--tRNA ligase [Xanthomonadales bacterium]
MALNPELRSIRGMHDILPASLPAWRELEFAAASVFAAYGFEEIRIPLLEKTEVFTRAIGSATDVVEKEMYTFPDRNGESLSLRPEGTAGVVRAVLQNGMLYGQPVRLWYGGPMFRYERPQKGRMRQFHQIGAEMFGAEGPDVDAELIAMGQRLWRGLGLKDIELQVNSLGTSEERSAYREALVSFLDGHRGALDRATRERAQRNPLRVLDSKEPTVQALLEDAPQLPAFLGKASREHFDGLCRLLDDFRIAYVVNPRLVRGLDYYSHTVFEWVTDQLGAQGTICAGGRYDGLVEIQGGKPWPGVGFAMGQERIVELINEAREISPDGPHVYVVMAGAGAKRAGLALAERLRDELPGLRVVCNPGDGSFKSQFKRADRSGARYALVIGEEEMDEGAVTVKPLRSQASQQRISQAELGAWLNNRLGGSRTDDTEETKE